MKIKFKSEYLIDHKNTILKPNSAGDLKKAIIFSGIAKPDSFNNAVKNLNFSITSELIFKDHHFYSEVDIDKLISLYQKRHSLYYYGKGFY
ncbi:MAG: tetraacyldisaccharide 4'-kinase [Ignavibacteria bacterium]|nr:tetraacyldisaccharide 4'-kinase [Ignavibacteria bacterium]